jgi:zinc transporter ZupT
VNGGPDPVTVAQVVVDEAFWAFTIEPSNTVPRLGRATITIPYPWVEYEPHNVMLLTSTGLTFEHEIPLAVATPTTAGSLGVFTMIGIYVGVLPVVIGLLFLPLLRRLSREWFEFMLALTAGLLIFLGVDALHEAIELSAEVAPAFQGVPLVLLGVMGTWLLLQMVAGPRTRVEGAAGRFSVAWLVALGIGLHNFGEGLAIGSAYAVGEAALGAFLIVGFMLHNTTEGIAIVAPVAQDRPRIGTLLGMGALAGIPTIFGAWLGGTAFSPLMASLFLAIGVGAIVQVVVALFRMFGRAGQGVWRPSTAGGVLAGLVVMYVTGLLVA